MSKTVTAGMSRREFLIAANAGALLLLLESCSLGPIGRSNASPPPGGSARQQALRLLRDAIRASPDHLTQRSADLVAAKDDTKIVEFVRDRLGVVPGPYAGDDPGLARRWGSAAALRGGLGTLRERADILSDMLTRAGFPATVSVATRPQAIGLAELYQPRSTPFAPDQGRIEKAAKLLRQDGFSAATSPGTFDPGPDATAAILNALPASLQVARLRTDLLPDSVPVVVFDQGGKKRYAFALGNLGIADAPPTGLRAMPVGEATPSITVTLWGLSNPPPGSTTPRGRLVELANHQWPSDALVGHQLLVTFPAIQGPKAMLESGLSALPVRVPMLRVQTVVLPALAPATLTSIGPPITIQGDVLTPRGGATPAANGDIDGPFGTIKSLSDVDRKNVIARAAAIRSTVNATAFPEVAVDFVVTDSSGAPVDGLDAASLVVKESGKALNGFALYSNVKSQPRPRVLIVYDAKFLDMWPSAAAKTKFDTGLTSAIVAQAAKTPFDTQVVGLGVPPAANGWAPPQADSVGSAINAASESADDPWLSVGGDALDQGVVAIVLVSDNDSADVNAATAPSLKRRLIASKVPVFTVPVGRVNEATTNELVKLSGGARLSATDPATPDGLAALIGPLVPKWTGGAYRLRYQAPPTGSSQRTVTIGLAGRSTPVASVTYQVPDQPIPPPSWVGLYVTIQVQGGMSSFRRLVGAEVDQRGGPLGVLDDPAGVAATRAALDGVTTIAFEPGTPTAAAVLDDLVSAAISVDPLWPVFNTGTNDQLLRAVPNGIRRMPALLAAMLLPTKVDPGGLPALKVGILQERLVAGMAEQHADFAIGVNLVIPIATDRHAGFRSVVSTSIGASEAEAATFADSAYKRLSGRQLTALASGDGAAITAFLKTVPAAKLDAWAAMARVYQDFHLLVPVAGGADAFWAVDQDSGAAKAVLLDGTGGGVILTACHYDDFDQAAIALAMLSIMCAYGGAIYPLFCTGINAASAAMCAAAQFVYTTHRDAGTPYGLGVGVLGAIGSLDAFPNFSAAVGVVLLLITLQKACSE